METNNTKIGIIGDAGVGSLGKSLLTASLTSLLLSKSSETSEELQAIKRVNQLAIEYENSKEARERGIVIVRQDDPPEMIQQLVEQGLTTMSMEEDLEKEKAIHYRNMKADLKIEFPDVKEAMFMDYEFKQSARATRRANNRKGKGKKKYGW